MKEPSCSSPDMSMLALKITLLQAEEKELHRLSRSLLVMDEKDPMVRKVRKLARKLRKLRRKLEKVGAATLPLTRPSRTC